MCTVTWVHGECGYSLFFNRDELRVRPPEHPPKRWNSRGVAVLAPLDDGGGGTWIAVNEHGLTAALLNYYTKEMKAPDRPRSRGEIPLLAAGRKCVVDAIGWATGSSLTRFQPFHLVLVDVGGHSALLTWDGNKLSVSRDISLPVTTSSFCPEAVVRARKEQFLAMTPAGSIVSPENLEAFHRSRNPAGGAWSVWMNRADACTRSLIRVDVVPAKILMRYEIAHPGFTLVDNKADSPDVATLLRAPVAATGNRGGPGE